LKKRVFGVLIIIFASTFLVSCRESEFNLGNFEREMTNNEMYENLTALNDWLQALRQGKNEYAFTLNHYEIIENFPVNVLYFFTDGRNAHTNRNDIIRKYLYNDVEYLIDNRNEQTTKVVTFGYIFNEIADLFLQQFVLEATFEFIKTGESGRNIAQIEGFKHENGNMIVVDRRDNASTRHLDTLIFDNDGRLVKRLNRGETRADIDRDFEFGTNISWSGRTNVPTPNNTSEFTAPIEGEITMLPTNVRNSVSLSNFSLSERMFSVDLILSNVRHLSWINVVWFIDNENIARIDFYFSDVWWDRDRSMVFIDYLSVGSFTLTARSMATPELYLSFYVVVEE